MEIKAIVASVGGTPAPIVKTIKDYEPEKVYFIVSVGERGSAAKLSVGLVGASPTIAILSWQCSYTRQ